MNKFLVIAIIIFTVSASIKAQDYRLSGMGNLKYSVTSEDNKLNPYGFAGNYAYLTEDDSTTWLKVAPYYNLTSGDYKRSMDPGKDEVSGLNAIGRKDLGKSGTFLGSTSYLYEVKHSVSKTLKYNPYNGEAFFFNDTTTGNYRYDGPQVSFGYGYKIFDNLFFGAAASYEILNGLKNVYVKADAVVRDVLGNAGLVYKLNNLITLGSYVKYQDYQEKIEGEDENLLDVDIYNYRGDDWSILRRGNVVSQKIKIRTLTSNSQIFLYPFSDFTIGMYAEFSDQRNKCFIPYSNYEEWEFGYARTYDNNYKIRAVYAHDKLTLGTELFYDYTSSWSNNSPYNLLLWNWNTKQYSASVGGSYNFGNILYALEYEINNINADSSKYIDNKFVNIETNDNYLRTGIEFKNVLSLLTLRLGYDYAHLQTDMLYGGKNVNLNLITAGIEYPLSDDSSINFLLEYNKYKSESESNLSRSFLSTRIILKVNSF